MENYDVVVIGSGISGALVSYELAKSGYKVLILESGGKVYFHDQLKLHDNFVNLGNDEFQHESNNYNFSEKYLKGVGGTSIAWLGISLRFFPDDFKMKSLYGVGRDWPISYSDLDYWYEQAEREIGVSGTSELYNLYLPNNKINLPMPPVNPSILSKKLALSLNGEYFLGRRCWVSNLPQAINTVANYDGRSKCQGSHSCVAGCPTGAKYDARVHVNKAIQFGAKLLEFSTAIKLNISKTTNNINSVTYKSTNNTTHSVSAKLFVLANNTIEVARLLHASKSTKFPNGLANSSKMVGRNLMTHPVLMSAALSEEKLQKYKGGLISSGIDCFTVGEFRKKHSGFRTDVADDGFNISPDLRAHFINEYSKYNLDKYNEISLLSLFEQLQNEECGLVFFDQFDKYGLPLFKVKYHIDEYTLNGVKKAKALHEFVFKKIGSHKMYHSSNFLSIGHIMGSTVMGDNPINSVVNSNLQAHDHENLYIIGGSVFPSSSFKNPTLTIAALALRLAKKIRS